MKSAANLFFVGPMGAGKTTIGRRIAEMIGLPFFDLDHEIEVRTGASIALIFDIEGEQRFRERESALLHELTAQPSLVLATGGGIVLSNNNRNILRAQGFVVWLDASIEAQLTRLDRDRQRPLLATTDRHERLQQLAVTRNPLYAEIADLHILSQGVGNSAAFTKHVAQLIDAHWDRRILQQTAT